MKLNYLSAAVATAIAMTLTACGGSDDNDKVDYTSSTPVNPAPTIPGADSTPGGTKLPDSSTGGTVVPVPGKPVIESNPVVKEIDSSKNSSVVGQSYNRNEHANFDYVANKVATNKSMPVMLGARTLQDKDMKNIILGAEVYTDAKDASGNVIKVAVNRYAGKINGDETVVGDYKTVGWDDTAKTFVDGKVITVDNTPLQRRNDTVIAGSNAYNLPPADTSGLFYQGSEATATTAATSVKSKMENAEDTTDTRIFGSKAFDIDNNATKNSYVGVSTTVNTDGKMTYTTASKFDTIKLDNVQYGRVSNNIDALSAASIGSELKVAGQQIVGTAPRAFNAPDAVNHYFYRGINETSLDNMNKLDQKGVFNYYGHALTYGINNGLTANSGLNSNSAGASQTVTTLGDFVKATYDVANKSVNGSIYNVQLTKTDNATAGIENTLVKFNGTVTGNTIAGTSSLASSGETGALKASFYGDKAQELGGAVNSIKENQYGTSTWGGVFGAKQAATPTPGNGNVADIEIKLP